MQRLWMKQFFWLQNSSDDGHSKLSLQFGIPNSQEIEKQVKRVIHKELVIWWRRGVFLGGLVKCLVLQNIRTEVVLAFYKINWCVELMSPASPMHVCKTITIGNGWVIDSDTEDLTVGMLLHNLWTFPCVRTKYKKWLHVAWCVFMSWVIVNQLTPCTLTQQSQPNVQSL